MQESAIQAPDTSIGSGKATRREFLGAAGAAVMTAASYRRVLGANDRVGLGVIGFGLIGKQHIATSRSSTMSSSGHVRLLQAAGG